MVKQWGFVHIPIGESAVRRLEWLIGYPFEATAPIPPLPPVIIPYDLSYFRAYLNDLTPRAVSPLSITRTSAVVLSDLITYFRKYLND